MLDQKIHPHHTNITFVKLDPYPPVTFQDREWNLIGHRVGPMLDQNHCWTKRYIHTTQTSLLSCLIHILQLLSKIESGKEIWTKFTLIGHRVGPMLDQHKVWTKIYLKKVYLEHVRITFVKCCPYLPYSFWERSRTRNMDQVSINPPFCWTNVGPKPILDQNLP